MTTQYDKQRVVRLLFAAFAALIGMILRPNSAYSSDNTIDEVKESVAFIRLEAWPDYSMPKTEVVKGIDLNLAGDAETVHGLSLGLYQTTVVKMKGIQLGGIGSGADSFFGIQAATLMSFADKGTGLQIGLLNNVLFDDEVKAQVDGIQIGAFNNAKQMRGIQLGIFNYTGTLRGAQVGLVNHVASHPSPFKTIPLLNVGF